MNIPEVVFDDRRHAGQVLAGALLNFAGRKDVIVCGLPRGGVIVADPIAHALRVPLEPLVVRKIGDVYNPEYAIGAVAVEGHPLWDRRQLERAKSVWPLKLLQAVVRERVKAWLQTNAYYGQQKPLDWSGKTLILVDDGLATGLTYRAAIRFARARNPAVIIGAVPVAPRPTAELVASEVDQLIVPAVFPDHGFEAVSLHFRDFQQVDDRSVMSTLEQARTYV